MRVERRTVDLTAYPDLVVIYLGMKVNTITGIKTLLGFGPKIDKSVAAKPDGLLRHESFVFSLLPPHEPGDAPVLARLSVVGTLVAIRAAYAVVEEFPARFRRHGILA